MKHKIIIFLILVNFAFSQVSLSDLNRISNEQLDVIRTELQTQKVDTVIEQDSVLEKVSIDTGVSSKPTLFFGYDALDREIDFFDNLPVPSNFTLGPGDVITISLWGETNLRKRFPISRDGTIFYENIGFINLADSTINEAEDILIKALSSIYSTLNDNDNSTELKVELESLRSINIYVTGQATKPGINLVHPYSDIYTAIIQAGGIKKRGSLRNIQLKRNDKIIAVFDFYSLLIDGENNFSSLRILDGDTIHIPEVSLRVNITGEIDTEGYYELLPNETIADLIDYSGLKSSASSSAIINSISSLGNRLSDDNARIGKTVNFDEFPSYRLNDGDDINILQVTDVQTNVQILGNVRKPGFYPASSTLKEVLDLAGGFNDPIFRKSIRDDSIVVIRKDNREFYGLEFTLPYDKSSNFELFPDDKIFVYENSNYNNLFSIAVQGEVNKRGNFQLRQGMTVEDAINLAEGFSPLANTNGIIVSKIFTSTNDQGEEIEEFAQVNDANLDFELTNGSVVNVLPLENVVSVEGNVYNPGLITYSKAKTVNKYINLAGGPKPNTLSTKIYVKRANGQIKKVTFFQGIGTIVRPGDTIFVPADPDPQDFDITSFIADMATTLANIAAILVVIDNQND